MNLNIFHKAEMYFMKALKDNSVDIAILNNLALSCYKKGDKKEALKYCEVILDFNPEDLKTKELMKAIEEDKV